MARPRYHTLVVAPIAWLALRRWGPPAAGGVMAGGVLIDLDHLIDFAWTRATGAKTHYIAPIHGWELAFATAAAAFWAVRRARQPPRLPDRVVRRETFLVAALERGWLGALLAGLAGGWLVHLVQDVFTNRPAGPHVYLLAYRLRHGFRKEITGWGEHTNFHGWSHLPWYRWF